MAKTAHFALHRCALDLSRHGVEADSPLFSNDGVWLGAMVPKRWARRAVTRNAIKRQIYSVSAEFEPRMDACAHVVRLRNAFDKAVFVSANSERLRNTVRLELHQLFARAMAGTPVQP